MALLLCALTSMSFAQRSNAYSSAEIGVFANYTRLTSADNANFYGAGGRIGFNLNPNVQIEAEGAYDFERTVTATAGSGASFSSVSSNLRMAHFMAGPKFQVGGSGPVHVFVTAKGGLINFSSNRSFPAQVNNIPVGNTDGVFYPAGGIELFAGWFGMRFEAGDEIYFDHGANNNLRVTVGPTIRF